MQDNCTNTIGGSITITSELANILSQNSYDVIACCFKAKTNNRPRYLNEKIKFFNLAKYHQNFNAFVKEIQPNLIIYVFPSMLVKSELNPEISQKIPKIVMFHSRPDYYFNFDIAENILKKYYINTTSQILFPSYYNLLPDFIKNAKVAYIPNYAPTTENPIDCNIERKKFVYLSRIDRLKGQEDLLKAFSKIAHNYPQWSLDIWGQSEPADYKKQLIKLSKSLKIFKQVNFCGTTSNPLKKLLEYDFCVFPSMFEGFPLGLIEAQSVGLPTVGFKYCTGVNELIIDNENGFLVENITDFAQKIELLINNSDLRKEFSQNTLNSVKKYSKENFEKSWIELIDNILNNKEIHFQNNSQIKYEPISINKIREIKTKYSLKPIEYIFSAKNSINKTYKIITILGIKFKLPRIKTNT